MTTTKQKPIEIRDGKIRAAIWTNESEKGKFYSVTLTRTYKDGETYKDSSSLSGTELLQAQRLLGKTYDRIRELQAADYEAKNEAPQ